jgi:cytoskeletal protein RodZ
MQTIGNYLKSGREARNIRLSEVAHSTKISKWYLDCLEKDEFDKIPGGPYIKGYISSYASYIGIEEDEILKRYDELHINSDDENEVQGHLSLERKKQKSFGFSYGKKKLLILNMVILILLASGIAYFFFRDQTHIAVLPQNTQDLKMKPVPASKINQTEARVTPNVNSVPSAELKNSAENIKNTIQEKPETANARQVTELSPNNHPKPLKAEDESRAKYQDATGIESLALLSSEKEPVTQDAPPAAETNTSYQVAVSDSKITSDQGAAQPADLYAGSAQGFRSPEARAPAADNMKVLNAVATSEITNKNPTGRSISFPWSTEKVYIWSMIACKQPPSSIRHTYYFEGQKVNDIELKIKSPQWRTWSYKTLSDERYIGQWKVDITSLEGELLQSIFFEVN